MTDLDLDAIEQRANQWASPLAVTCPSCGSAPGDRCYGSMSRPHDQRREAVRLRVITDVPALLAEVRRLQATQDAIRAALARHPRCDRYGPDEPISCGWKLAVHDIQNTLDPGAGDE